MSWCPEGKRSAVKTQRRQPTQVVPQYQQPAVWPGNSYVMVPRWEAFSCQDTATSSNTSSASMPTASDVARQQLCHGTQMGSVQLSRHSDVKQHKLCLNTNSQRCCPACHGAQRGSGQLSRHSGVKQHNHQPANDAGVSAANPLAYFTLTNIRGLKPRTVPSKVSFYSRPPTTELPNVCSADRNMVAGTPGCRA